MEYLQEYVMMSAEITGWIILLLIGFAVGYMIAEWLTIIYTESRWFQNRRKK